MMAVMVLSLPLTIGLVQTQHSFRSRAAGEEIQFVGPNIEYQNGQLIANQPVVGIQLASPFGPPPTTTVSSKTGFLPWNVVRVVYGQEEEDETGDAGQGGVIVEPITEGTCGSDCDNSSPATGTIEEPIELPGLEGAIEEVKDGNGTVTDTLLVPSGTDFGHYEQRPAATRPYEGLDYYRDLDDWQRSVVDLWEQHPYTTVWTFDISPGPENDYAGWGPPPPGYAAWRDIEKTPEGALLGGKLPWPPAGEPRGGWFPEGDSRRDIASAVNDPLYYNFLTPEEASDYKAGRLTADDVRRINQARFNEIAPDLDLNSSEQRLLFADQNVPLASKKPTASKKPIVSRPTTNRSVSPITTRVSPVGGMNPDICTTNPTNAICTGGAKNICEGYYQQCENGARQFCTPGVLIDGICRRDTTVSRSCGECVIGSTATASDKTGAITQQTSIPTTVSFKIAENPSDLATAKSRTYTEPLIFPYSFENETPGKKFLFVEFTSSDGKTGGCGPEKDQACIASVELSGNTKVSECTPQVKALANIRKDGIINDFDALQHRQILASIASGQQIAGGDVNQDGDVNAEDYSLVLSCFGNI
jgi:hypothetical protein